MPNLPELAAATAAISTDPEESKGFAARARALFSKRGVAWDKRLSLDEWIALCEAFVGTRPLGSIAHPFVVLTKSLPTDPLPERFFQYMSRISRSGANQHNIGWYPGLTSQPFHDPHSIALCDALETNYEAIRQEVEGLSSISFHSEAEPIDRVGRWEVLMLFEVGRQRKDVCDLLPILTHILESSDEVRKSAGLVYLSRLKARSRVALHRGGTNSRLRLHFGIEVPQGDCGLRVDNTARTWTAGKCVLFDDYYEHEVWNETDHDRLVLLVDVWHPDLTAQERICLDAINKQIARQAMGRAQYWEKNRLQREAEKLVRVDESMVTNRS